MAYIRSHIRLPGEAGCQTRSCSKFTNDALYIAVCADGLWLEILVPFHLDSTIIDTIFILKIEKTLSLDEYVTTDSSAWYPAKYR